MVVVGGLLYIVGFRIMAAVDLKPTFQKSRQIYKKVASAAELFAEL